MTRPMKDSGIEWIGEIPKEWGIRKIKYCADIYTGNSISDNEKDNYTNPDNAIPYIATKDINVETNLIDYDNGLYIPHESNFKIAPENSILLCIEGGSAGKKIAYTNQKVCFVNKLCCFETFNCNSKLLYYICQSDEFLTSFYLQISGLIGGVSQSAIKNISVVIPPKPEQSEIVSYLDKKCGHIDAILKKTRGSIEEYKQLKQSVITQAVTKGIRPNRPMKDSGIEWIGEIPEGWKILKGKHCLTYVEKSVQESDKVITCFRDGEVTLRCNRREDGFTISDKEIGYQGIDVGDLIVHGMDGFAGAIGISDSRGKASPVLNVLDTKQLKKYMMYYLRSMAYSGVFLALATGIRIRTCDTNWNKLKELLYTIPPKPEQSEIVSYLDKKCSVIDNLIQKKEQLVEELETYKKSLIYEYVTGKKTVITREQTVITSKSEVI